MHLLHGQGGSAGASRTGFCPGCFVKGTWPWRLQENSKALGGSISWELGIALPCAALGLLVAGRSGQGLAGRDQQGSAGRRWAHDGQHARGAQRLGFSWLLHAHLRFVCAVVCWWFCSGAGLAAPVPAASPPLCPCPPERFNHRLWGCSCTSVQSQSPTLGTERVWKGADPGGTQEFFLHSLKIPFPKGPSWGGAVQVTLERDSSPGQELR